MEHGAAIRMLEEKLASSRLAARLAWIVIYGPTSSRKSALMARAREWTEQAWKADRSPPLVVSVDLARKRWQDPMNPVLEITGRLEEEAGFGRFGKDGSLTETLRAIVRRRRRVLLLFDHLDVLPNEGLRVMCRHFKQVRESSDINSRVGLIAACSRSLEWLRDQGDSPFFGLDPVVVHDGPAMPERPSTLLHYRDADPNLRWALLHLATTDGVADIAEVLADGHSPRTKGKHAFFDEFEETGLFSANHDTGHYSFRSASLGELVKNCLPIVSSQPGLPDFQDGSIAANLRNAVALKRRLAAAQNLTEAAGAISALWNLFQEEAAPKLYAGIYQREDASSRWIAMPDGLSVPPAVCEQALAIALERRYSHVAVAEGLGAVWCRYATEDRVSVLVAVTGGESVLNESTTWHFQNVLEGLAARIDSLSLQEFGRQLLRRGGNVPVARNGSSKSKIDRRAVFLVHGRNLGIKEEIDAFLRKLELKPVWWEDARSATGKAMPFTFEIVEAGLGMAQAVLVLMTGDDEVRLKREYQGKKNSSAKLELQARPNVLIEAGMAMASHRERTIVLEVGELRPISDFDGLNSIRYDEDKQKARAALVLRLQTAGCDVPPDAHTRAMAAGA